ncbi:hypothetical protein [Gluconobacter frateurii]|uniref:Uncharacterized protein n=1 Tax=Gluconobacter frateurii NRIC 0228 TaxID=1307946 RepID=A0ABQ0Q903_9PROT|nr:hypothetical protein [Gluconobacter frateurii]GBR09464.1 hypothetical protein AA0228_0684 [Gluconobacter frateurii NRIC 0228]GLP91953.1 hypothetical protein GCM10007868_30280 [Gluconobacter frateurii]
MGDAAHVAASVVLPWPVMIIALIFGLVLTVWAVVALLRHLTIERRIISLERGHASLEQGHAILEREHAANEERDRHTAQMLQKISNDQEQSNKLLHLIVEGHLRKP